jgi:Glycosyltransferase WbsX
MEVATRAKLIAMYFPQLHAIPENNEWWGEGFTDWVNVKASYPQFQGHLQPRVPLNDNYYDQANIETLRWQIELAKSYGVYGFCHYHYWFDGQQLLETPTNLLINNSELDMPFCLSWANETWSRRWDGRDHHILIKQTHPPSKERWKAHFDYLLTAWSDDRAIKVDGKPVFVIYRPHHIDGINQMLDYWRELAHHAGLDGLYLIAQKQYEFPSRKHLQGFDGIFQFQPFESIYSPSFDESSIRHTKLFKLVRALPEVVQDLLRSARSKFVKELTFYDYEKVWEAIVQIQNDPVLTTFPGAFTDWDNTARYKNRATIVQGASPERFEFWFDRLVQTLCSRNLPEPFIFLNAWNEWAESAYLEPDEKNEYRYLEVVKRILVDK